MHSNIFFSAPILKRSEKKQNKKKMEDKKRSFTVTASSIGATGGRYISTSPEAAAKKAGRQLFRKKEAKSLLKKKAPKITFMITETTREAGGSRKSEPREYTVTRTEKNKPETFVRGGVEITVNFDYKVVATSSSAPPAAVSSPRASSPRRR